MKRIFSILCLLLSLSMLLSLVGCSSPQEEAAAEGDTLTVIISADVPTMDPNNDENFIHHQVTAQVYECLFDLDENYRVVPCLAESYEYEDDKTLIIKLHKGVKFHNGEELKASDVLFTYNRILTENLASALNINTFIDIEKCEIVDDYTLKLVTFDVAPTFLHRLAMEGEAIINEKAYNDAGGDFSKGAAVGTGPFKFESYVPGDSITLIANENYRIEGEPKVDKILFRIVLDAATRAMEAESGRADIVLGIANTEMETVDAAEGVSMVSDIATQTIHLMLNTTMEPLNDIRVREAIARAIDVESVVAAACGDYGMAAQGWVAPGILGYEPFAYEYDLARAKELLAEAGYADGFDLDVVVTNAVQERLNMTEAIQGQLSKVGINVTINAMDNTAVADYTIAGKHQSTVQGYSATSFEAERALCQFVPSASYYALTMTDNERIWELYEESARCLDVNEREALYKEGIKEITDDYLTIPLWHKGINAAVNDRVGGFVLDRSYEVHDLSGVYFK